MGQEVESPESLVGFALASALCWCWVSSVWTVLEVTAWVTR